VFERFMTKQTRFLLWGWRAERALVRCLLKLKAGEKSKLKRSSGLEVDIVARGSLINCQFPLETCCSCGRKPAHYANFISFNKKQN
jgi:hypothetical protein